MEGQDQVRRRLPRSTSRAVAGKRVFGWRGPVQIKWKEFDDEHATWDNDASAARAAGGGRAKMRIASAREPVPPSAAAATSRLETPNGRETRQRRCERRAGRREKARCDDGERERAIESDAFDRVTERAGTEPRFHPVQYKVIDRLARRVARPPALCPFSTSRCLHHSQSLPSRLHREWHACEPFRVTLRAPFNTACCALRKIHEFGEGIRRSHPARTTRARPCPRAAAAPPRDKTPARGPRPARVRVRRPKTGVRRRCVSSSPVPPEASPSPPRKLRISARRPPSSR